MRTSSLGFRQNAARRGAVPGRGSEAKHRLDKSWDIFRREPTKLCQTYKEQKISFPVPEPSNLRPVVQV
jgi:hypothetical protein